MAEPAAQEHASAAVRRVTRNTGLLAGADIATKVGLLALYAIIARALGTVSFGDFTLAISLVFVIQITSFGTDLILSRETARSLDRVHDVFWNAIVIKLAFGVPALIGVVGFAALAGYDGAVLTTVSLLGLASLLDAVALTMHAVLRGREDMGPPACAVVLERGLTAALGAVALLELGLGLASVGLIYLISSILAFIYILYALHRRKIRPRLAVGGAQLRGLLRSAVPLGVASAFAIALARIDAVILSVLTDSEVVGLYGAAYRLFEAPLFMLTAFAAAIFPVLSRLNRDSSPSIRHVFEISWMALTATTAPLGALLILFPSTLVEGVYGESFAGAETAARILGCALLIYPTAALSWQLLIAQDRERQSAVVVGLTVAFNVALNFALIPSQSLEGAALAMAISLLASTVALLICALRVVGRVSVRRVFAAPGGALVAMALVGALLGDRPLSLAASLIVYTAAFLCVELSLHREDLFLFIRSLRSGGAPEVAVATQQP